MSIVLDGTTGITTPGETVSGTGVWSVGSTQIYKDASGNVGIGTGSPAAKLNISSTVGGNSLLINGTTTGANFTRLTSSGADGVLGIESSTPGSICAGSSAYASLLYTVGSTSLQFGTSSTVRATLDSSGNLGLGVTPSAWNSSSKVFQNGPLAFETIGGNLLLGTNYYRNSSNVLTYIGNGYASVYVQQNSAHLWYTAPSGTAGNPITFTQAMTLDASGNLGIGTTSPSAKLHVQNQIYVKGTGGGDGSIGIDINSGGSAVTTGAHAIRSGGGGGDSLIIETETANSNGKILFQTNGSERARIDSSGNLLVGTTDTNGTQGFMYNITNQQIALGHTNGTASGIRYINFLYNSGSNGSITQNGTTAVAYNTSSDYRLKNTIAPMTGALDKVSQLKPVTYKWNADDSDGEGFIAHELAEVCPHAVTGAKDAVDEEGNPVYQGIDTSFLVATLTAAIQEQQAIITTLTERLTALENK